MTMIPRRWSCIHPTRPLPWVLLCLALAALSLPAFAQDVPKTVILGFDGADGDLTHQWMEEGELPNLRKLRDQGTFAPLRPTIPSQTPVSWSTFATGLDPGRHGVYDFLKRDPKTYRPSLGLITEGKEPLLWGERNPMVLGSASALVLALLLLVLGRLMIKSPGARRVGLIATLAVAIGAGVAVGRGVDQWLPDELPTADNPRQGETFWEALGKAGVRTRVLRLPQNFPPDPFHGGELLTGLGTPDLSLRVGKPFYFTSELFFEAEDGGFSLEVVELVDNRGRIETVIKGPPDNLFSEPGSLRYLEVPMVLTVSDDRKSLDIEVSGSRLTLKPGDWSDWTGFTFPYNPVLEMNGMGRFHLMSLEPEVRLYLSPIQFDPEKLPPGFELSTPPEFAAELKREGGAYKTIGWAVDTWSLNEGTIDEALFLEDVEMTAARGEKTLRDQLAQADEWDVLVHYFEFTDRVQHMMFRLFDKKHPRYDPVLAAEYGDSILNSYKRMDAIVGEVMAEMPAGTNLFVVSDHGFSSWRWSMNYNTWLARKGYMRLNGEDAQRLNLEMLFDQGDFFVNVDWSKTKAYALGFGNIYINLEGREAQGIVKPEDREAVMEEIRQGLLDYVHEETGLNPVAHIYTREEAYSAFDPELVPDMIATNADYYRAGWQDTLGGVGKHIVEPNTKRWSGDHCSLFPPLVEGIFFTNTQVSDRPPYMGDIMPTLLAMYGVESDIQFDAESLMPR
ncbi:MAG: alkaline phosphatase family protein [Acidobacteriota bacterium]